MTTDLLQGGAEAGESQRRAPGRPEERIRIIEGLRGFAALAVAWHHFTVGNAAFPTTGWLRGSGEYGWLGVEIFFVISGFIIPFAMHRAGYRFSSLPRFLAKRLVRLEPPYLVSIVVTLGLWWISSLSPGFSRPAPSATQLALHLGYLNAFFGYDWINTAYWTLAIEFQYYLVIAVAFPLLIHARPGPRLIGVGLLCALSLAVPSGRLIFHYLGLFVLGILTFQRRIGLVSNWVYVLTLAGVTLLNIWTCGGLVSAVAVITALLIGFAGNLEWRLLSWVGGLSYSLYLIHAPLGGRVVNLGARFAATPLAEFGVVVAAVAVSVGAAWVLWRWVELPALRFAASVRYGRAARG